LLKRKFQDDSLSKSQFDVEYKSAKEEFKFFGFKSPRKFLYAIGRSVTIFYLGLYLMFTLSFINDPNLKRATVFLSFLATGIGIYFIIWAFWARGDFPKNWYYTLMVLSSILGAFIAYWLTNYRFSLKQKIEKLIRFISVDAYFKYVKQEDREEYIDDSFTVYDDITKS